MMSLYLYKNQTAVFGVSSLITDDDATYGCHLYKDQMVVFGVSSLITDDDVTYELSSF